MANKKNGKPGQETGGNRFTTRIMSLFTLVVFCIFPLVVTNAYFNILETKYLFYCGAAITMIVLATLYGLFSRKIENFLNEINFKEMFKRLSLTDWAIIAFWIVNVCSWLSSEWRWEAFWGTSGRYNGVFLVTVYMLVYFLMTRFFRFRRWYLDAFLAVGLLVCIFGMTDYFQMDIFGFKVRMIDRQKSIYTSTLGNINTYTVYVAAVMVISMIMFATEERPKYIIWYYIAMAVSGMALIMGESDNAYLSIAALFGLSPLYLFRTKRGTSRYLISLATLFTVFLCLFWINRVFAGIVLNINSLFSIIAEISFLPIIVVFLWVVAGVVTYVFQKKKNGSDVMGKWLVYLWMGVIALVVGTVAFAFYDATVAGNGERYGAIAPYVTFNEAWGTDRGYVWMRAMELWTDMLSPVQKMIGYGSDTFALLMLSFFPPQMQNGVTTVYDSVHNEYLNYLLTTGLLGMTAYIVFLVSAIRTMWKRLEDHPEIAAVMFAVVAYMVQALININLPIVMPIILHFLTMGLSKVPDTEK